MQFIHLIKGAYPKQLCTFAIDFFEINSHLTKIPYAGQDKVDSLSIKLDINFKKPNSNNFNLESTIERGLFEYKQKFPLIDSNIGKWKTSNYCLLTRYEPNNFYKKIHCDSGEGCRNRILVWMIFLNDIKTGGGTYFNHQDYTAEPIAGDMHIWPASWTHMHVGVNAPYERKYIITGWIEHEKY